MDCVEEIEAAINKLPPADFKRIVQWLKTLDQSRWDEELDRDFSSGKLDFLFEEAESESREGLLREWPEHK